MIERPDPDLDLQIEIMRAAGLSNMAITRLSFLKIEIANGDISEMTPEHKRLEFCQYLIEHSRITDDLSG